MGLRESLSTGAEEQAVTVSFVKTAKYSSRFTWEVLLARGLLLAKVSEN